MDGLIRQVQNVAEAAENMATGGGGGVVIAGGEGRGEASPDDNRELDFRPGPNSRLNVKVNFITRTDYESHLEEKSGKSVESYPRRSSFF